MLARRDADAEVLDTATNSSVAQNIVGSGRLFDEPGTQRRQLLHVVDRLLHVPHLVGIDHDDAACWSCVLACQTLSRRLLASSWHLVGVVDNGSHQRQSSKVIVYIRSHLELEMVEALFER